MQNDGVDGARPQEEADLDNHFSDMQELILFLIHVRKEWAL